MLSHSFSGSGIWARLSWMRLARGLSQSRHVAWAAVSAEGSVGEDELPGSPKWLLVVLTGQTHQCPAFCLLCMGSSQHGLLPQTESSKEEREQKRTSKTSRVFLYPSLLLNGTSCPSCLTLWLGMSHEVSSTLTGRRCHRGMTPREGSLSSRR